MKTPIGLMVDRIASDPGITPHEAVLINIVDRLDAKHLCELSGIALGLARSRTEKDDRDIKDCRITAIKAALKDGADYCRELLSLHDMSVGRGTPENRAIAETLERNLERMRKAMNLLREKR